MYFSTLWLRVPISSKSILNKAEKPVKYFQKMPHIWRYLVIGDLRGCFDFSTKDRVSQNNRIPK